MYLKIFIILFFLLYQNGAYSKATDKNDFNQKYLSNYFSKYAKNKNVWKIINIFIITFMGFLILFILKEMIS